MSKLKNIHSIIKYLIELINEVSVFFLWPPDRILTDYLVILTGISGYLTVLSFSLTIFHYPQICSYQDCRLVYLISISISLVGDTGLEPVTSSVWRMRSTAELIAQIDIRCSLFDKLYEQELSYVCLLSFPPFRTSNFEMVGPLGFEPRTNPLWAGGSTAELWARNKIKK